MLSNMVLVLIVFVFIKIFLFAFRVPGKALVLYSKIVIPKIIQNPVNFVRWCVLQK